MLGFASFVMMNDVAVGRTFFYLPLMQQKWWLVTRQFLVNSGFSDDDVVDLMRGRHETRTQECRLRTVSDVLAEEGVTRVDLLKINVEKAERDVLAGIVEADWPKIRQITMQVHEIDDGVQAVSRELTARGFIAGETGNAPGDLGSVRFVRILAPKRNDPAAQLVARQFGPRTLVQPTAQDLGPGVDVIVGDKFAGLVKAPRQLKAQVAGSGC